MSDYLRPPMPRRPSKVRFDDELEAATLVPSPNPNPNDHGMFAVSPTMAHTPYYTEEPESLERKSESKFHEELEPSSSSQPTYLPPSHSPLPPPSSIPRISQVPLNNRAQRTTQPVDIYTEMPARPQVARQRPVYAEALQDIFTPAPAYRSPPRPPYDDYYRERGRRYSESSMASRTPSNSLEEGGIKAQRRFGSAENSWDDVSTLGGRSRADSEGSYYPSRPSYGRRRADSAVSVATSAGDYELDPEDPRVTGRRPKKLKQKSWANDEKKGNPGEPSSDSRSIHAAEGKARVNFILKFARCLLVFGAPTHRIEGMLNSCAKTLDLPAEFIQFPSIILASFGDHEADSTRTEFIKAPGGLDLGRASATHSVYLDVVHDRIGPEEATMKLTKLLKAKPIYGRRTRCAFAFGAAAAICPLAFGGTFLDMWISGVLSAIMLWVNVTYASKNPILANIFDLIMALVISFVARALSTIDGGRLFCYQAVTSGGVVLILPGFLVLVSSLDLASKHMLTGSIKLVYTVVYTLFLAFVLTVGSDIFYIVDAAARQDANKATAALASVMTLSGNFTSNGTSNNPYAQFFGSFTFSNETAVDALNNHMINGCYRDASFPWFSQVFPEWTLFILVPAFSLFISVTNMQPIKSKEMLIMIVISVCSFLANKYANKYAFANSEIVSTVGAFVVGILGNGASKFLNVGGFTVSVTGVLFLVPSGLSAAGGLADNYRGSTMDYFTASLQVGARMIQVGIGITLGLLFSGLLLYAFGKKGKAALFAF